MTSWHRNEYILKGVFLGLWAFVAIQVSGNARDARIDIAWVLGWLSAGLLLGGVLGTALQLKRGLRPAQNWGAFPLLVLLESPTFIYAGLTLGLAGGVLSGREFSQPWAAPIAGWFGLTFDDIKHLQTPRGETPGKLPGDWLGYCAVGGAILGFGLYRLRQMEAGLWRFGTGFLVAAASVYIASEYLPLVPGLSRENADARLNLGVYILIGLPFFYLLTFCGEAEESEVEIMAVCALLGVSIHLMNLSGRFIAAGGALPFLLPMTIYFVYATRVLPGLRVFKHVLRGYSYMNLGKLREALYFFRRALTLNPTHPLATQGMLALHKGLTLATIDREPELVEELDFGMCLDRAETLVLGPNPPTAAERTEAERFLSLVETKKPAYLARVDYLRAVSQTFAKEYDAAADTLRRLLDPEVSYHQGVRRRVLFPAWNLALRWSAEVEKRVGWKELDKPGRRVEAIAAVERQLTADPTDAAAKDLKLAFYDRLTEAEFVAASAVEPPKDFNYDYVEQLGLALVDDADPDRRERGMAYLRVAGRGLPERGPGIFRKLADVYERMDDRDTMRKCLEHVKRVAAFVDPANLAKDQRDIYFSALKKLATEAEEAGNFEKAIDELRLYLEHGGRQELETYRKLADLYGKNHDALNALLMVETALAYSSTDADLLQKKDSYYYSVEIPRLTAAREKVAKFFDTGYCVRKAMGILNAKEADADMLDWATHLTKLASIVSPASNGVRLVEARVMLRRGERDEGIRVMEDIREGPKGGGDDQDAWYSTTKILGQLYLDELNRPDLAVRAFLDYKEYQKSGADTLYQIARSYEAMSDHPNAKRFYEAVTAYEQHPLYWDAKEALRRLGAKG